MACQESYGCPALRDSSNVPAVVCREKRVLQSREPTLSQIKAAIAFDWVVLLGRVPTVVTKPSALTVPYGFGRRTGADQDAVQLRRRGGRRGHRGCCTRLQEGAPI